MQRRFKLARKVGNASAGWRRRRGGVIARSRRLLADRRGESIPIGNAERLGDQLEALTDGDVETLGGEGRTQRACHGFSVAKVAHVLILCLNETGVPVLALLTRRSGKGYEKLRYVHRTPKGASGRSYLPGRKVAYGRVAVNRCERRPHRGLEKRIAAHLRRRFKRNNSEFWHAQFFAEAARHGDPNLRPPDWRSGSHRRRPILTRSRARDSFRSGRRPRTALRKSGLRPAWSPRYRAIP